MIGIILAGGHGTRLGPLGSQLNKALVGFGGRPMIINQITAMREVGCDAFVIVVSPRWEHQVAAVLGRAFGDLIPWDVVVQHEANGPADAVAVGAEACADDSCIVIMADTYVDAKDLKQALRIDRRHQWTGCSPSKGGRSWCYLDEDEWVDGFVASSETVMAAIGCYFFPSTDELAHKADIACKSVTSGEVAMSPLLNLYGMSAITFTSWRDTGDVTTLAKTRKTLLRSRSFNDLTITDDGFVHKKGRIKEEWKYLQTLTRSEDSSLFPRSRPGDDDSSYEIEYVDSPTLAELFLYWPSPPTMWTHILNHIIETVAYELWPRSTGEEEIKHPGLMATEKAMTRLIGWDNEFATLPELTINGEKMMAGVDLVYDLIVEGENLDWSNSYVVFPHGDLNFTNILYSIGNDIFRLIDPRGDYALDVHYELAKLKYSYNGFSAISHGLFDAGLYGTTAHIELPKRGAEVVEMDNVLRTKGDIEKTRYLESLLFLAGAPLHDGMEGLAMYLRGVQLGNEVLS